MSSGSDYRKIHKHPCFDCGTPVNPGSLRCRHCAMTGKSNSQRTKEEPAKCIDCGKPISRGSTRCRVCRTKQYWINGVLSKTTVPRGESHPYWKGGQTTQNGYVLLKLPNHPRAHKSGYVSEHIINWEKAHNKPLPAKWIIHHLNGIPSDNRPVNLLALPDRKHKRILKAKAKRIQELEALIRNQGQLI